MKPYDIGQALTSCESLESKSILRVKNGGKAAKDKKLDLRIGEFLLFLLVSRVFSNIWMNRMSTYKSNSMHKQKVDTKYAW